MTCRNLSDILQHYPAAYRGLKPDATTQARGFSGAVIVRLCGDPGVFCLRGWPHQGLSEARICGLHRLLALAHDRGLAEVPVPVARADGTTVVRAEGRLWQLEPWMPGAADFRHRPTEVRLENAVTVLARWHQAAACFKPTRQESAWFGSRNCGVSPAVLERLERIRGWSNDRLAAVCCLLAEESQLALRAVGEQIIRGFLAAAPIVAAELERAAATGVSLQPCLRDIWHDHVLFTGDDVTGLIDASACRCDTVATDLARLVGSLVGDEQRLWQTALDRYHAHRQLTAGELDLVRVLDRSGVLLSGMTWLERLYVERRLIDDLDRVRERMQGIAERLARLAGAC